MAPCVADNCPGYFLQPSLHLNLCGIPGGAWSSGSGLGSDGAVRRVLPHTITVHTNPHYQTQPHHSPLLACPPITA